MKPYITVLIWILLGAIIGLVIFMFLQPNTPQIQQPNISLPQNNSPPPQNLTPETPTKMPVVLVVINAPCAECNFGDIGVEQTKTIISNSTKIYLSSVQNISYPSEDANMIISEYNITELPSLVVIGDSAADPDFVALWNKSAGSVEPDGTLVSRYPYPPFYNITAAKPMGLIKGIAIQASNCSYCLDATEFMPGLEDPQIAMVFTSQTILNESDPEAQVLIQTYNITKLPVLLLSEDAAVYPIFAQISVLGTIENGWFVLREVKPPYVELPTHEIHGVVNVIYLYNSSCKDCFDIHELGYYLSESAGLYIDNETNYDSNSSEAKTLIGKYNLTALPALLYSPQIATYPAFEKVWKQINNSVESDGWFVFRNYAVLNKTYQNISN
ncbi:Uncharacterised protein [Candidatus Bilamarchaeum dharawalense]|uniref:Uncharacterized protein n=1 Tax=Candidatus Bilamarchaeum dharawalense TaxID=2885759 RepID=A0A5E4LT92_9ARCH|nr:Uncharacterised protein [Candidatus Bilamarchaeum dharawalense]